MHALRRRGTSFNPLWETLIQNLRPDMASVELKVFLAFELLGGIGNIAMLITAIVSSRVNRHLTWINFCITWVIYALSYTLL